jgi:hypothetical protein
VLVNAQTFLASPISRAFIGIGRSAMLIVRIARSSLSDQMVTIAADPADLELARSFDRIFGETPR